MNLTDPAPDSLLKHPSFVLFWTARVCANFAFQMVGVAMGWQMYVLTGSALLSPAAQDGLNAVYAPAAVLTGAILLRLKRKSNSATSAPPQA